MPKPHVCHHINLKQTRHHDHINDPYRTVYEVKELKNSVQFEIGALLEHSQVEDLCNSPYWHVTVR